MNIPDTPDGIFEGGILFDGCDHRTNKDIVDFSYYPGKLGLVRWRGTYFRAEFLEKKASPQFSLPFWDETRSGIICETHAEAKQHIDDFVARSDDEAL
jgi:hypothetical protein